ncbi:MAG TPA: hypothetical protein VG245_05815 [Candidatus Dormibacteraeota bacterium]|jgi:hypothetical protein|nr:hypothetical protein [Candidatus Dormibacteraeota bacterium]
MSRRSRLSLNRETVRELVDSNLDAAFGGVVLTGTETTPEICQTTILTLKLDANLSQLICFITQQPRC